MLIPWSFPKGNFIQISAQHCPAEASHGRSCPVPRVPAAPRAATPPEGTAACTWTGFSPKTYPKKTTHVSLVPLEHWRGAGGAGASLGLAPRPALGSENAPRAPVLLFFSSLERIIYLRLHIQSLNSSPFIQNVSNSFTLIVGTHGFPAIEHGSEGNG